MSRITLVARYTLAAVALVAYTILAYRATVTPTGGTMDVLIALLPWYLVILLFAWRSSRRYLMLALCAIAAILAWQSWVFIEHNLDWVYFLQHVGINTALSLAFGRTLFHDRVPLCSRFATLIHGPLEDDQARYVRGVTFAWTIFFATVAVTSVLLFAFFPITVWSTFANVLSLPLVGAMFAGEYAVRLRVLPHMTHIRFSVMLRQIKASWSTLRTPTAPPRT